MHIYLPKYIGIRLLSSYWCMHMYLSDRRVHQDRFRTMFKVKARRVGYDEEPVSSFKIGVFECTLAQRCFIVAVAAAAIPNSYLSTARINLTTAAMFYVVTRISCLGNRLKASAILVCSLQIRRFVGRTAIPTGRRLSCRRQKMTAAATAAAAFAAGRRYLYEVQAKRRS